MDTTAQVTLKEYVEKLINEHDRRYEDRFEAQEKALNLALDNLKNAHVSRNGIVALVILASLSLIGSIVSLITRH